MTTTETQHSAFQLKGSLFTLTVLQLLQPEVANFESQLKDLVEQAPKFFNHTPVVIDLQLLPTMHYAIDFRALAELLRTYHLIPVGIRGGTTAQNEAAMEAGLAIMAITRQDPAERPAVRRPTPAGDSPKAPVEAPKPEVVTSTAPSSAPVESHYTMTITKPVRSGQQIYAKGADLIVLAPVSPGAELLADGNIHVYGPLRGRALAGVSGDESARIFCSSLEAELISVAGHYIINEAMINNHKPEPQQIFLENGKLRIAAL